MKVESTTSSAERNRTSHISIRFLFLILGGFAAAFALANAAFRMRAEATQFYDVAALAVEMAAISAIFFTTLFLLLKLSGKIFHRLLFSQLAMWLSAASMGLAAWLFTEFYQGLNFSISPVTIFAASWGWSVIVGIVAILIGLLAYNMNGAAAMFVKRDAAVIYLSLAAGYLFALALPLVTVANNW